MLRRSTIRAWLVAAALAAATLGLALPILAAGETPGLEPTAESMSIDEAVDMLGLFEDVDGRRAKTPALPPAAVSRQAERPAPAPSAVHEKPAPVPDPGDVPDRTLLDLGDLPELPGRAWLDRIRAELPGHLRGAYDDLKAGKLTGRAQKGIGVALVALLCGSLLIRLVSRGRGEVIVCIDYPPSLLGSFAVKLSTRSTGDSRVAMRGRITGPAEAARARERAGTSPTERHLVSRETQFTSVPARSWTVSIDGYLQTSQGDEVVATHFEEKEVRVKRGASVRLHYDVSPRACPIEVKVFWDKKPVQDARVALRGAPGSLRFARSGPVQFALAPGDHTLVIGAADRVAEREVTIDSFQPVHMMVDLSNREAVLFSGCPPAVEPYLAGDVAASARALQRDGQESVSHSILARFHCERGQKETAAKHYEQAGLWPEAAELWQSLTRFEMAAQLFEKSGDHERAAENYRSAGKLLRAGDAYARADAYESAVECFRKAGDVGRWIDALAKKGAVFEAANVALDQGDRTRAIQTLNAVLVSDENYPEAVVKLAQCYEAEGHVDLAIHKLEELIATRGDDAPLESVDLLAQLCEQAGEYEKALQILERLRARSATYPNLATRIEAIKKRSSKDKQVTQPLHVDGAADFTAEFRYEIQGELGRGGMGIVFSARDRRLGRTVALKRLPDNLRDHPKAVELFLREARAAAALNHPNIVTLFDAGQEAGTYYITMELLEGLPLIKVLRQRQRLSPVNVAKIGGQVATGLQYAHEKGVVHRDIKTANLFFTNKKVVKIMDFGLAKMVEEVRRSTTVIGGTPYYMAPEQSAGDRVDHRADLYALGVTFYELLTGSVPFKEGDVAFHHRHAPVPDPRTVLPDLSGEFAELILHMMAKTPSERIATADEVARRLESIARHS